MNPARLLGAALPLLLTVAAAIALAAHLRRQIARRLADKLRERCHYDAADLIDPRTRHRTRR